jgi:hypothetical protein
MARARTLVLLVLVAGLVLGGLHLWKAERRGREVEVASPAAPVERAQPELAAPEIVASERVPSVAVESAMDPAKPAPDEDVLELEVVDGTTNRPLADAEVHYEVVEEEDGGALT